MKESAKLVNNVLGVIGRSILVVIAAVIVVSFYLWCFSLTASWWNTSAPELAKHVCTLIAIGFAFGILTFLYFIATSLAGTLGFVIYASIRFILDKPIIWPYSEFTKACWEFPIILFDLVVDAFKKMIKKN